jgi:hypothetical protein
VWPPRNTFAGSCMTRMGIDLPRGLLQVEWNRRSLGFARDDKARVACSVDIC